MTSHQPFRWIESDLFLSDYPLPLLRGYSDQTLAEYFKYALTSSDSISDSFKQRLIDHLWRKYDRLDLVPFNDLLAQLPLVRLDDLVIARRYSDQTEITLGQFEANFNQYIPLSLKRLRNQLKPTLVRLDSLTSTQDNPQLNELKERLDQLNIKIFRR